MTSTWLTARELAGLPGLPGSEFRTRQRLLQLRVPSRPRAGREGGGGMEFDCAHLPAETRAALLLQQLQPDAAVSGHDLQPGAAVIGAAPSHGSAVVAAPLPPALPNPGHVASRQAAACADARAVLLRALEATQHLVGGLARAADTLSAQVAAGSAGPEVMAAAAAANARARKAGASVSPRSLFAWHTAFKAGGWAALLPAETRPQPVTRMEPDVAAVLKRYASTHGAARNLTEVAQQVNAELGNPLHTWRRLYDRARRALGKVDKVQLIKARHTGAQRDAKLPFVRRGTDGLQPLDVVVVDGHSFKAQVRHPNHGQPFTPEVTVVLDVKTRLILGWSVSLSESTIAVGDALRHAVGTWGKPAIVYSDQGSGEKALYFDCDRTGLWARLGVTHKTGKPRSPQGHGVIERSWRTHMIRAARQFATYMGTGADENTLRDTQLALSREQRAVKRAEAAGQVVHLSARCPSWRQFVDVVAAEVERYNTTHRHRTLPRHEQGELAGHHWTPAEAMQAWLRPEDLVRLDGPALRHLFMPAELRTARRGEVTLLNQTYFSPELMHVDGEQVSVHYDIHDPAAVWVWTARGDFVCEARWAANKKDFFPKAVVDMARERRVAESVKHREAQIATAQRELQPVLQAPAPAVYIGDLVPPAAELVQRVEVATAPADARPFFESAADRYEWMQQHRSAWSEADAAWIAAWAQTDDYAALRHYFEGRGIAWPEASDDPAFKSAG